jgi:hypothetical protein
LPVRINNVNRVKTDAVAAVAIACALASLWTFRAWADVSALRLPDADDMMRLQQIRDWLSGQKFADLNQYRLGAGGVPMHWSRIPDLVPAAIIWVLAGVLGRHAAEVTAVIVWPAILLTAAVWLSGRIARLAAGPEVGWRAMIVAVAAFPATTAFAPGRIDHHGLQLVLLLVTTLALVSKPSVFVGAIGGLATVASLAIGIELAPLLAAAALAVTAEWVLGTPGAQQRLAGLGLALLLGTAAAGAIFHSVAWDYAACDGFTAISARLMLIGSLVPLGLALLPRRWNLHVRLAAAVLLGATIGAVIAASASECLSPYGRVPALLRRLWLSRVTEAQPLLHAPGSLAIAHCGLMFMGLAVSAWRAWQTRERAWIVLMLLQLSAAILTFVQLRGSLAGALLAAPALGSMLVSARHRGAFATIGAWLASGGLFYPVVAQALPADSKARAPASSCTAPDLIAALSALPAGNVMAPIDTGAPAIASTHQRLIAGAYHRNGQGNLAMYSFFLGDGANAQRVASRWHVRWVVACDGFGGLAAPFALRLQHGEVPEWLRPVKLVRSGARIFEVAL